MFRPLKPYYRQAQTAVEYMLLLAVAVTVVLVGFRTFLPKAQDKTGAFYEKAAKGIMGKPPHCGDGKCEEERAENKVTCCVDCGGCNF